MKFELPKANSQNQKVLIVEGGGMKGAFSGGVLACMCKLFPKENFDLVLGVSAGSCSLAYYVLDENQEEAQKILDIWKKELDGNKFISFLNPILKYKAILNQSYLLDYLFQKKYPLPIERLESSNVPKFYVVVSDIQKKIPRYVQATKENIFSLLKAATALPIATRGKRIFENFLFGDGGNLDPIPIEEVIKAGYKNITLVLNQPKEKFSEPIGKYLSKLAFPFEPEFAKKLRHAHHLMYNRAKRILFHPPPDVKIKIVAPEKPLPISTLTTNSEKIIYAVNKGWKKALQIFSKHNLL